MIPFFSQQLLPIWDVDATQASSYSGSGTAWNNLVTLPADGAAQSAYNFTVHGTNGFTGGAGNPGAYFAMDGTSYFQLTGANTTFLANLNKMGGTTAVNGTIAVALYTDNANGGNATAANVFGTESGGATGCTQSAPGTFSSGANGISLCFYPGARPGLQIWSNGHFQDNAGFSNIIDYGNTGMILFLPFASVPFTFFNSQYPYQFNSVSSGLPASQDFPININTPNSNNASGTFCFGSSGSNSGATPMATGSRMYGCYGFLKTFDASDMVAFINILNLRQGNQWATS